jgi:hypothetical protein
MMMMKFHPGRAVSGKAAVRGLAALLLLLSPGLFAEPLVAPAWGFQIDIPEGYEYLDGNGRDRFSFALPGEVSLDLAIYPGAAYASTEALGADLSRRLGNRGDRIDFNYREKDALLIELNFSLAGKNFEGWGLGVTLETAEDGPAPLLLALAYGPPGAADLQFLYLSLLDSIAPSPADRLAPGPITEFAYPREERQRIRLANSPAEALIYAIDPLAAQSVVDREFAVLSLYAETDLWEEAWVRFYRVIFRDAFERLGDISLALEREIPREESGREFAERALRWVQSFEYERDLLGSDFINLVSAAVEGRGDCDSRALLWAILLNRANIPAAIMVSPEYSHAMGLADIPGTGARFEMDETNWVVAETTQEVSLGLIGANVADPDYWIGVSFE